ncbi:villin [Tieghemostelium lacteum]|uniref:Villin n=1 Tax=Tieghemostelium lacteum TaxID=361077 RepID=A0A151ZAJ2_TIELA|nr:villin [Tieghemostelium lacteum]|eukprot:KYQ90972.1 villin [Tieghemostelium lacteum]
MKTGRKLPSKNFKTPGSTTTSTSIKADENSNNNNSGSILSQALETATTSESKKKIVLPPGAGGILGSMASLAMEAQKKKLEKDNKLLSSVINQDPDAPVFVKGRSQSVSVTSTLKDNTGKFLNHKKTVDTYSGQRVRLIQCKGKKRILSKEVEVSIQSLNKMDSFVLDCGIDGSNVGGESADSSAHSTIYIFYGSKSTANKKSKAVGIAEIIKSHERGGHATIIKLDEGDNDERFYKLLKGTPSTPINPDGGDDLEAETHWAQSFTLSKYETSTQTFSLIDTKSLSMELLASDSYFVLDTVTEFYEWSGRNVDINLKDTFHQKAQEKLKSSKHRQAWVESVVLSEGGETVLFREKFFDWPDLSHEVSLNRMGFGKKKAFAVAIPYEKKSPAKMNNFEAREMISLERAEEVMKSDGKGEYEIWYLDQMKMYPLPKEEYGQFYSGCCYIIRYTYTKWNALKYIIYYWQGVDASRQDVGSSSLLVKDLYIETCNRGECTQEPERQGRESSHFLYVFNGRMVVHRGARGEFDFTSKRLYHVFGRTNETITAVQCTKVSTTQLNSRDCFILNDKQQTYLWESKGASKALKEQSNQLISQFFQKSGSSLKLVKEGQEPEEFWKLLGATTQQHKYANYQYLFEKPLTDFSKQIRLYAVINTGTIIRADEIFRFSQYDLQPSKVFILDNQVNVFIWSGSRSQEKEKKRGAEIAIDYIKLLEDGRSESDVLFITEKEEPLSFTCFFHSWDTFRFQSANGADEVDDLLSPKIEAATNFLKKYYQIVPYDQLTQKNTPPEIDRSVLEMYLSDEEFEKHLGMTKQEWESFPSWKKSEKKKSANLF